MSKSKREGDLIEQVATVDLAVPTPSTTDDPFDLTRFRISQNFAATAGVKKEIMHVPVRKPLRQDFVRVHPSLDFRLETGVLEDKEAGETYLVEPALWAELSGEVVPKVLFTAITRQDVVFLWPIRLPGEDGKLDDWNRSALDIAQRAMDVWLRVASSRSLGAYEAHRPVADLPDPVWPDLSFKRLVEIAFRDRFIRSLDHPVLRRLRGEW